MLIYNKVVQTNKQGSNIYFDSNSTLKRELSLENYINLKVMEDPILAIIHLYLYHIL